MNAWEEIHHINPRQQSDLPITASFPGNDLLLYFQANYLMYKDLLNLLKSTAKCQDNSDFRHGKEKFI